jgi:hypothetical protein
MRNIKRAGVLTAAAISAMFVGVSAAGADHGGPHCDELPANITPEHPDWDDSLDADGDGTGCDDDNQPTWTPPATDPATPPAPAAPAPEPADPAAPAADLDCGDPGTSHNMPVDPNNDPNRLDADNDGLGCEDPGAFGDAPPAAAPAVPQPGEPDFTG